MAKVAKAKKARITELDIVRALAILAVVLIHGTSEGSSYTLMGGHSTTQLMFLFINKMSNFAVPLFIFISGLVLFYTNFDNWNVRKFGVFYGKRVRSVIVPYVLWSFFYYIFNSLIGYGLSNFKFSFLTFVKQLQWADSGYHLYFMIIIIQFYLIFPLLLWPARRFAWFRGGLPFWGLLIQGGFYTYGHWFGHIDHKAELCVTYFSLFTLGGFIGIYYDRFRSWIDRHIGWVFPLGVSFGLAYAVMFISTEYHYRYENTWFEALFTLYGMASGVSFIWLAAQLQRLTPKFANVLTSLGVASFGVYLMHPTILTLWRTYVHQPGSILYFNIYSFTGIMLTLTIPWIATLVYKKIAASFSAKKGTTSNAKGAKGASL